jgi:hypothetical protein
MESVCVLVFVIILLLFVILYVIVRCGPKEQFVSLSTIEDRKEFYLGGLTKTINVKSSKVPWKKIYIIDETTQHSNDNPTNNYLAEMTNFYKALRRRSPFGEKRILLVPGDVIHSYPDVPVIAKTRPIDSPGLNVILPLNNSRHWKPVGEAKSMDNIPWDQKENKVVWRGVATGRYKRVKLVENWSGYKRVNKIDVGFTDFNDGYMGTKDPKLLSGRIDMKDLLKNKYLISVEGNDVASNLKWILATQTVCIMPPPTIESWLMESKLVPWVHYVPVDADFGNLQKVYLWCTHNPDKMKDIIGNANAYMEQFNNTEEEEKLVIDILEEYCNKVNLTF